MKYTGQLVTGDFEDNTMTFEIDGEMILQSGKYSIEQIQVGNQVKNLGIANVSGSLPSEIEIQKYIDDQPYYGTCTTEYKEGIEQGIKWVLDRLKVASNDR